MQTGRFKLVERLSTFLLVLIAAIVVSGGFKFTVWNLKIDLTQVDTFGIALLAILGLLRWRTGQAPQLWVYLEEKILNLVNAPAKAVAIAGLVIGLCVIAHGLKHLSFATHALDQIYIHPMLWRGWSWPPLSCDLCLSGTYLGEHFSWVWVPFSLLLQELRGYAMRDFIVFIIQGGLAAIALDLWLKLQPRASLRASLAGAVALLFIASRSFRNGLVWDFREDQIAFFALAITLLSLEQKSKILHWTLLVFGTGIAWLSKENVALLFPPMAVALVLDQRSILSRTHRLAISTFWVIGSLGYAFYTFKIGMPAFNGAAQGAQQIATRLSAFGTTPLEILSSLWTKPGLWWSYFGTKFLSKNAIKYLFKLSLPFLILGVRSWCWLIPAAAALAMNIIGIDTQISMQFHYDWIVLPFLAYAWLRGAQTLAPESAVAIQAGTPLGRWVAISIACAVALSGRWPSSMIAEYWPTREQVMDSLYLASLPYDQITGANLTVAAQATQLDFRGFSVPPSLPAPEELIDEWLARSSTDGTRIPGHGILNATRVILDQQISYEAMLGDLLILQRNWKEKGRSPSGRYRVLSL